MDNVWFHFNNYGWDKPVAEQFKKEGLWNKVFAFGDEYTLKDTWDDKLVEEYVPKAIYDNIYPHFSRFADMRTRQPDSWPATYREENYHDRLNLFNLFLNFLYNTFKKEKISLFIMHRAPHAGFDFLTYLMAREMGIKTLILEQTRFPNRFFLYTDQFDFGIFQTSKHLFPLKEKIKIDKKSEKNLFYMNRSRLSLKKRMSNYLRRDNATIRLLSELRYKSRRGRAIRRYDQKKDFEKNKGKYTKPIDLNEKFVYFALHMQPEKSTSSWGGKYVDQLLAIERLSDFVPDDVKIYVKENPKQGPFMRGKYFYRRLRKIKKTTLAPNNANTYDLIKNSLFVSTVTGTVAWEAITGGKPALVFGWGAWYKTLPGIFIFDDHPGYSEILNYKVNHDLLEENVNQLLEKTGKGFLYPNGVFAKQIIKGIPGYTEEKNVENLITSLRAFLYKK